MTIESQCPLTRRTLCRFEVYGLAMLYFSGSEIDNMVSIAFLESRFDTAAHNVSGEDSRGLWQINVAAWPEFAVWNLYDPQVNAYCARRVFEVQGYGAWFNSARALGLLTSNGG